MGRRERENIQAWGSTIIGVEGGAFLLVNLKHKSGDIKLKKRGK